MKGFVPSLRFPSLTATQTSSVLIVNGLSFSYAAVNVLPPPRVVVRGEGCLMNSKPEVDCDIIRNGEINQLCWCRNTNGPLDDLISCDVMRGQASISLIINELHTRTSSWTFDISQSNEKRLIFVPVTCWGIPICCAINHTYMTICITSSGRPYHPPSKNRMRFAAVTETPGSIGSKKLIIINGFVNYSSREFLRRCTHLFVAVFEVRLSGHYDSYLRYRCFLREGS